MKVDINRATTIVDEELNDIFDYHSWNEEQQAQGKIVRDILKEAFATIIENVPPCPDRSVALRQLRDARMNCNSAITHGGKY